MKILLYLFLITCLQQFGYSGFHSISVNGCGKNKQLYTKKLAIIEIAEYFNKNYKIKLHEKFTVLLVGYKKDTWMFQLNNKNTKKKEYKFEISTSGCSIYTQWFPQQKS
jgi:hypothetical protein